MLGLGASSRRHQHRVDDVDQPVGGCDVCLGDVDVTVELDAALRTDLEVAAIERGCGLAVEFHHVSRRDLASDHVILEDRGQFRDVLEQTVYRAGRQLGERIVGGGKNGERTGPFEGVNEACRGEGCGQRLEMAVGNSNIDEIVHEVFLQLS